MSSNVKNRGPPRVGGLDNSDIYEYTNFMQGLFLLIVLMLTSYKADIQILYNDGYTLELNIYIEIANNYGEHIF